MSFGGLCGFYVRHRIDGLETLRMPAELREWVRHRIDGLERK